MVLVNTCSVRDLAEQKAIGKMQAMIEIGLNVPRSGIAHNMEEAERVLDEIGLPVIIRPAYILGGKGICLGPNNFMGRAYQQVKDVRNWNDDVIRPVDKALTAHGGIAVLRGNPRPVRSEADAVSRLRPGVDGVILSYGAHRGTFLPQVWESLCLRRLMMSVPLNF